MSLWSVAGAGAAQVRRKKPDVSIALVRFRRGLNLFAERRFPKNERRELNYRTPRIPKRGAEKFLKREFLAENGGKQPVSAEPSEPREANKNAPDRQPAPAATTQNAPWTLNPQKTCEPPVSLAAENRPPMTRIDNGRR